MVIMCVISLLLVVHTAILGMEGNAEGATETLWPDETAAIGEASSSVPSDGPTFPWSHWYQHIIVFHLENLSGETLYLATKSEYYLVLFLGPLPVSEVMHNLWPHSLGWQRSHINIARGGELGDEARHYQVQNWCGFHWMFLRLGICEEEIWKVES